MTKLLVDPPPHPCTVLDCVFKKLRLTLERFFFIGGLLGCNASHVGFCSVTVLSVFQCTRHPLDNDAFVLTPFNPAMAIPWRMTPSKLCFSKGCERLLCLKCKCPFVVSFRLEFLLNIRLRSEVSTFHICKRMFFKSKLKDFEVGAVESPVQGAGE